MSIADEDQDQALLAAIARGEPQAFWTLWLRHAHKLLAICLREMNGNRIDAEDAHGQTLLRAHQSLPRFASNVRHASSWLARVTINVCRDLQRARTRGAFAEEQLACRERERCLGLGSSPRREEPPRGAGEWDFDPESLIARLPDRLRGLFVLRVVQNQPYEAVANRFAVTCVTARKRVQEARAMLRAWRDQPSTNQADRAGIKVSLRSRVS